MSYSSGIDPSAIPGRELDPDGVIAAADGLATEATAIRDAGADAVAEWRRLSFSYEAPEAQTLFSSMNPVETKAREFGDALDGVAGALRAYGEDIRSIKADLAAVRSDAWAFRADIRGNDEWQYDQGLVDRNDTLIGRVNALQVRLWETERTCANAIRALYGADPWRAMQSEGDPQGYGVSEIPIEAEMPWGSSVPRKDHCPKSAAVGVKNFVWDGLVVDGLWGTVTGLSALVGFDGDWGWSVDNFTNAWEGVSTLIGNNGDGTWSWGTAGDAWLNLGKGVIAYDMWGENPGRAAGGAVFNVATMFIPVAGQAVNGVKGASMAGRAGQAANWLNKATRIVDLTDPAYLLFQGGKVVVPKLGDMLAGIRIAAEGFDLPDLPEMPNVGSGLDAPPGGLGGGLGDGIDDVAGPAPVRDPDGVPAPSLADEVTAPPVPEPVTVGGGGSEIGGPADAPGTGPGGSGGVSDGAGSGGSGSPVPGGTGHAADDLVRNPGGTDAPAPSTGAGTGSETPSGFGGSTTPDTPSGSGTGSGGGAGADAPGGGGVPGSGLADELPGPGAGDDVAPPRDADADGPSGVDPTPPAGVADELPTGVGDDVPSTGAGDDAAPRDPDSDTASGVDPTPPAGVADELPTGVGEAPGAGSPGDGAAPEPAPRTVTDASGATHPVRYADEAPSMANQPSFEEALARELRDRGMSRGEFDGLVARPIHLLSRESLITLLEIREALPRIEPGDIIQKIIPPEQARYALGTAFFDALVEPQLLDHLTEARTWLDESGKPRVNFSSMPDEIRGYVARLADVSGLSSTRLFHDLGLGYEFSTFVDDGSMFAIRTTAGHFPEWVTDSANPIAAVLDANGPLQTMREAMFEPALDGSGRSRFDEISDLPTAERPTAWQEYANQKGAGFQMDQALNPDNPHRGNGFGGTGHLYAPESTFGRNAQRVAPGAEMWHVRPDGSRDIVAVFDGRNWQTIVPSTP